MAAAQKTPPKDAGSQVEPSAGARSPGALQATLSTDKMAKAALRAARGKRSEALELARQAREALAEGANPNVSLYDKKSERAMPALTTFAMGGNAEGVQALLEAGAAVGALDSELRSAAWRAARAGSQECLELLLEAGADLGEVDEKGNGLLAAACDAVGKRGEACLALLRARGAKWPDPATPAAQLLMCKACSSNGGRALAEDLLEAGMSPEAVDGDGFSALGWACMGGSERLAVRLLAAGADPNRAEATGRGYAPLHAVAQEGRERLIALLVEAGANVDVRGRRGITPLMVAAAGGKGKVVEALLARGALPDLRDDEGWSALDRAVHGDVGSCVRALVEGGADLGALDPNKQTPAMAAVFSGNTKAARALLACGVDFEKLDPNGRAPMEVARRLRPRLAAEFEALQLQAATPANSDPKTARAKPRL